MSLSELCGFKNFPRSLAYAARATCESLMRERVRFLLIAAPAPNGDEVAVVGSTEPATSFLIGNHTALSPSLGAWGRALSVLSLVSGFAVE